MDARFVKLSNGDGPMIAELNPAPFFVAGGTVPPDSPSYVERAADRELLQALLAGEYCYVLNSRQMGKSSLAVRAIARLTASGVSCGFVDLTRLGGSTVTPEQWYSGLLMESGRALGLRAEAAAYLRDTVSVGAVQRLLGFLQEVALQRISGPIVLLIDEIDAVRSLPFPTDELFAGIRQLHNGRASHEDLKRLTFCLLGAALPSDLIQDPRTTPFNVGRRIELKDFTPEEAKSFASPLGPQGLAKLQRVLYWTNGHPFLTQALCAELAQEPGQDVDDLVRRRYLDARARDSDTNLTDVANRLLGRGDSTVSDKNRADTLSAYEGLLKNDGVLDDESNLSSARIKMSGIARIEAGRLKSRNRIYQTAFDRKWLRENMPGEELRRQRRAFWQGALRTATLAAAVILVISSLSVVAIVNARRATELERKAQYDAYAADMRNMNQLFDQHNLMLIRLALDRHKADPWRGWEWDYWNRIAHRAKRTIHSGPYGVGWLAVSPDGRLGVEATGSGIGVFDIQTGALLRAFDIQADQTKWLPDSKRFLALAFDGSARLCDAEAGKILKTAPHCGLFPVAIGSRFYLPGNRAAIVLTQGLTPAWLDVGTLTWKPFPFPKGWAVKPSEDVSPDGTMVAWPGGRQGIGLNGVRLLIADAKTGRKLRFITPPFSFYAVKFSPDSRLLALGGEAGDVAILVVATGKLIAKVRPTTATIEALDFSSDGKRLLVVGRQREAALLEFDGKSLRVRRRFQEAGDAAFLPNHEVEITYWDTDIYDERDEPDVPEISFGAAYTGAAFVGKGQILGIAGSSFRSASFLTGKPTAPIPLSAGIPVGVTTLVLSPDGHTLQLKDTASQTLLASLNVDRLTTGTLGGSGEAIAIQQGPQRLVVCFRARGAVSEVPINLPQACYGMNLSPDGSLLGVSYMNGQIGLFDAHTGRHLWDNVDPRYGNIHQFTFSPDLRTLATASDSDEVDLWDVATGKHIRSLIGHSQSVWSVAWSPDGQRIATGSEDHTIRMWDAHTGADLGIIGRHDLAVNLVAFLPGGRSLESYGADGEAKLWMTSEAH